MSTTIPMRIGREPYGRLRFTRSQLGEKPIAEIRRAENKVTVFVYRGFGSTLHASVRTPTSKACFKLQPEHVTEETDEISADPICLVGDELLTWLIANTGASFKESRGRKETVNLNLLKTTKDKQA